MATSKGTRPTRPVTVTAIDDLQESVWWTPPPDEYEFDLDEQCTVSSVSESLIELDCPTYDPQVDLQLTEPWQPNLAANDTVHVIVTGSEWEWGWAIDWRINHADDSLAVAGRTGFNGLGSAGQGALAGIEIVQDVCTPICAGEVIFEKIGLLVADGGEQGTLFTGNHAIIGALELWNPEVERLACDKWGDSGAGYVSLFLSAIE